MLTGDVIRSGEPASARKSSMLWATSSSARARSPQDPVGDAERVDADRLRGGEALAPRELERALEPRHRDVGRVAGDAELPEELERPPLGARDRRSRDATAWLSSAYGEAAGERAAAEVDRRRGEQRLARRAVRSGAAASASSKRRCASWRSIRRSQNGHSATHKRSASPGARSSSVSSATRRFAASRSSRGEPRSSSASASAQRACRSASAAVSPASSSRSRAYRRTVSSRR